MKKLFIIIAALFPVLTALADSNPVFESSLITEDEFARWTVVDKNSDNATWKFNPDKQAAHYPYAYQTADDWLISPAIKVDKAGAYMLTYEYMGSSYGEMMDVFYGTQPDVESMGNLVMDLGIMDDGDNYKSARQLISVNNTDDIYIAFHAKSEPDKFKILLRNVKLVPAEGKDVAIDAIKTVESGYEMGMEDITITIANYGVKAVSGLKVSYQVNDNTAVEESISQEVAPGEKLDYTFTQKADFSATGNYVVKANVSMDVDEIPENNERTVTIRHKGPQSVPYTNGFEPEDGIDDIVIFDLNEDPADDKNGRWSRHENSFFAVFSRTGDYSMVYWYSKNNPGNDWFILEPIYMDEGYYAVKFWYSSDHKESFSLSYGDKAEPASMTNQIVRFENVIEPQYKESSNIIHIEKSGVYYFGFKSESMPDQNILCIDDFSISKIENINNDLEVSKLELSANGYVRKEMRKDLAFSVVNKGILSIDDVNINVSIDDKVLYSEVVDMNGEETKSIKIKDGFGNLSAGMHTLLIEATSAAEEENMENNYLSYEFKMLGDAEIMYDFEEGRLPEGFIIEVADGGSVNSGLKAVFPNNEAWAPIEIVDNEYYGKWMLASASWLEGADGADRWCILPKVHIGYGVSEIVWAANSGDTNEKYAESYEVLVSTSGTDLESFEKIVSVENENFPLNPSIRGYNLSEYAGKDIYIAFRLVTPDGYFMTIDNVGLYGAINNYDVPTGIGSINGGSNAIVKIGNVITCSAQGITGIDVYDAEGQLVMHTSENEVNIENLHRGIYVVRVNTAEGTLVNKFSK